jgi:hypothetical protein
VSKSIKGLKSYICKRLYNLASRLSVPFIIRSLRCVKRKAVICESNENSGNQKSNSEL